MRCPACHGDGGRTEVILDDGTGPWEPCCFCYGKGWLDRKLFFRVLGWLSAIARKKRKIS